MVHTEPPSPCIRSCTLDPNSDICLGCYRTLDEILGWSSYSAEEKSAVLDQLEGRKQKRLDALARSWRTP